MKRSISFFMAIVLCLSVFFLVGCKKKNNEEALVGPEAFMQNYDFESYVDEDSSILGAWEEKLSADSKAQKTVWNFENTTALNIVETVDNYSITTPCAYNFDEETSKLIYLNCNTRVVTTLEVEFDGNTMTFTDESGNVTQTFTKQ